MRIAFSGSFPLVQGDSLRQSMEEKKEAGQAQALSTLPFFAGKPEHFKANFLRFGSDPNGNDPDKDDGLDSKEGQNAEEPLAVFDLLKNLPAVVKKGHFRTPMEVLSPRFMPLLERNPIFTDWFKFIYPGFFLPLQIMKPGSPMPVMEMHTYPVSVAGFIVSACMKALDTLDRHSNNPDFLKMDPAQVNTLDEKAALQVLDAFLPDRTTRNLGNARMALMSVKSRMLQVEHDLLKVLSTDGQLAFVQLLRDNFDFFESYLLDTEPEQQTLNGLLDYLFDYPPRENSSFLSELDQQVNMQVITKMGPHEAQDYISNLPSVLKVFYEGLEADKLENSTEKQVALETTTAFQIATDSNSDAVEPKHFLLAIVRAASELAEKAPQYINAFPDQVPVTHMGGGKAFPAKLDRMALDALIPADYRRHMTQKSITSVLNKLQAELEDQVYPTMTLHEKPKNETPLPSQGLADALAEVLNKPIPNGNYLYVFTEVMKESLKKDNPALAKLLDTTSPEAIRKASNIPSITFDDVGGYADQKNQMKKFANRLLNPEQVNLWSKENTLKRGLLLYGDPGNGKTYMCKAMANYLNIPLMYYNGAEFANKYVGESEKAIRDMFAEARRMKKGAVIVIDEADALLGKRGRNSGDPVGDKMVDQFLSEMDGIEQNNENLVVILLTNRKDDLDPAVLRPGRITEHLEVPNPSLEDTEAVLRVHARGLPIDSSVNFEDLAKLNHGLSSAKLANLVESAAEEATDQIIAGNRTEKVITMNDFDEAFDNMEMGRRTLGKSDPFTDELTVNHETLGHGLIAFALGSRIGTRIRTLSSVRRGNTLGHVAYLSEPGERGQVLGALLQILIRSLSGRAAEKLTFDDGTPYGGIKNLSLGASQDYEQARKIITVMMQNGQLLGNSAGNGKGELNDADLKLMEWLLTRAAETAEQMIRVLPEQKRKAIVKELLGKGVELRNQEAYNFYKKYVSDEEVRNMQKISDEFMNEVISTINKRAEFNTDLFKNPEKTLSGGGKNQPDSSVLGDAKKQLSRLKNITKSSFWKAAFSPQQADEKKEAS